LQKRDLYKLINNPFMGTIPNVTLIYFYIDSVNVNSIPVSNVKGIHKQWLLSNKEIELFMITKVACYFPRWIWI